MVCRSAEVLSPRMNNKIQKPLTVAAFDAFEVIMQCETIHAFNIVALFYHFYPQYISSQIQTSTLHQ